MPGFKPAARKLGKSGKGSARGKLTGGHWVTIHGHPAYIRDNKVVAGGIPGHTHDAKGKPTGVAVPIAKEHVHLARAHVVKGLKADRIRKNAPGKDASGVDHGAMKLAAASRGATYSHGAPSSKADREHLARAEKAGGAAVKVVTRPGVVIERGRNSTGYHVGGAPAARVVHSRNEDGRYVARLTTGGHTAVEEHRTLRGAHRAARKHAAAVAKEDTAVDRFVVRRGSPEDVAYHVTLGPGGDSTHIHVIHRGRGSSARIPGSGFRPK